MSRLVAILLIVLLGGGAVGEAPVCRYEVTAGPAARTLDVEARFAAGSGAVLVLERGLLSFVEAAEVEQGESWRQLAASGSTLLAPECEHEDCRIRYRFQLARAAQERRDLHRAFEHQGALLAPPSSWLLRPLRARAGRRYRVVVRTPPGLSYVSGVSPAPGAPGAYEADIACLESAPYSGFGAFETGRVSAGGGVVDVAIAPGQRRLANDALLRWVEQAAGAVSGYYGQLPVPRAQVLVLPGGGRPVGFGTTRGSGGGSVIIFLGGQASEEHVARDWVLTHELTHLGFPDLSGAPSWIEEGLATYVEPIARVRAGLLSEPLAWREMMDGLPRGLPGRDAGGLDSAEGFGRIYWGGALYWLLCDLELRERTGNARGLQHVLRSVVAAGGNGSVSWSLDRTLDELERAAGLPVFRGRLRRMGSQPVREDLEALWSRLGVVRREEAVVFDDAAPLAAIRRSLTAAR